MKLILIRHAKAKDREDFAMSGRHDALRPLTAEGRRRMKRAAKGLRTLYPQLDRLATSPLLRAAQTARIIHEAYANEPRWIELKLLTGEAPPGKFLAWLKKQARDAATVAIVGHEPSLSRWIGFFTTGQEKSIVTMKKGAACAIDFPGLIAPGKGVLVGLFQSRDLRRII